MAKGLNFHQDGSEDIMKYEGQIQGDDLLIGTNTKSTAIPAPNLEVHDGLVVIDDTNEVALLIDTDSNLARIQSSKHNSGSTARALSFHVSSGKEALRFQTDGSASMGTSSNTTSAMLDLTSTTQGLLPPRLTTAQSNTLSGSAIAGITIYNSTLNKLEVFTGSGWETVTSVAR